MAVILNHLARPPQWGSPIHEYVIYDRPPINSEIHLEIFNADKIASDSRFTNGYSML